MGDTYWDFRRRRFGSENKTHMSRGYTIAFAMTAPVAPATARPHGGIKASFDCPAIAMGEGEEPLLRVCGGSLNCFARARA